MQKILYLLFFISLGAKAQNTGINFSTSNENPTNKYLASISELKNVNDDNSAEAILNYLGTELKEAFNKQTDVKLVSENISNLVDAFTQRLAKSQSTAEVDQLFELINTIIQKKDYDANMERYISYQVSEALKVHYDETGVYLGNLLFEGYKAYLKDHEIPRKPSSEDVKSVFKYVIAASGEISLERNILLAQVSLLSKGDLNCNDQAGKITEGTNESKLNKLTFSMLNRSADELIQQSGILDTVLDFHDKYYQQRDKNIKLFNYKLDKFSQMHRISRGEKELIFDDPLLLLSDKKYIGCQLIFHVNRKSFYTFPN